MTTSPGCSGILSMKSRRRLLALMILLGAIPQAATAAAADLIRSVNGGPWSDASTWEGGKVPGPGARVQIRTGHVVRYEIQSDVPIRSIHVAGILEFARDRDTRLDVGLIKVQPGDDASENGFDCDAHGVKLDSGEDRPSLLVGLPGDPVQSGKTALIRLTYQEGDRKSVV